MNPTASSQHLGKTNEAERADVLLVEPDYTGCEERLGALYLGNWFETSSLFHCMNQRRRRVGQRLEQKTHQREPVGTLT